MRPRPRRGFPSRPWWWPGRRSRRAAWRYGCATARGGLRRRAVRRRVRGARCPGESPGVLSLVTVLQFAEDLTDRQAAAMAVRAIDWKYALGAELTDTGFDASVLSRFRARLAGHGMERVVFDRLLELLEAGPGGGRRQAAHRFHPCDQRGAGLEPAGAGRGERAGGSGGPRGRGTGLAGRTDRRDRVQPPLRAAGRRLAHAASQTKRDRLAKSSARTPWRCAGRSSRAGAPVDPRDRAVQLLRQILVQTYYLHTDARGREVIRKREPDEEGVPPGQLRLASPYDPDARWAAKGEDLFWWATRSTSPRPATPPPKPKPKTEAGTREPDEAKAEPPKREAGSARPAATEPDHRRVHHRRDRAGCEGDRPDPPATRRARSDARRALPRLRLPLRRPITAAASGLTRWSPRSCWTTPPRPRPPTASTRTPSPSTGRPARSAVPPGRAAPLEPGETARHGRDRHHLRHRDLPRLPFRTVHHLRSRRAPAHPAAPGTARGPRPGPRRAEDRDLEDQVRPARGSGGHHQPGGHHRHPPGPLPRPAESPPPARLLRHRAQLIRLDAWWTRPPLHPPAKPATSPASITLSLPDHEPNWAAESSRELRRRRQEESDRAVGEWTGGCPIGPRCEVCGRRDGLAVECHNLMNNRLPYFGPWCATVCAACAEAGSSPTTRNGTLSGSPSTPRTWAAPTTRRCDVRINIDATGEQDADVERVRGFLITGPLARQPVTSQRGRTGAGPFIRRSPRPAVRSASPSGRCRRHGRRRQPRKSISRSPRIPTDAGTLLPCRRYCGPERRRSNWLKCHHYCKPQGWKSDPYSRVAIIATL